jgi:hypothetical protein
MIDLFGEEEIRALSWKQPYADLMFEGKIETRTWDTKYRGLVLICSSKYGYNFSHIYPISGDIQMVRMENVLEKCKGHFYGNNFDIEYQHGLAIGVGRLVNTRIMTGGDEDDCFVQYRDPWIEEIKDKKTGKIKLVQKRLWCHIYEDVKRIEPFPWKGSQGWKMLNKEEKNKIIYI